MIGVFELAFLVFLGWGVVQIVKRSQGGGSGGRVGGGYRPPIAPGPPAERSTTMEVDGRRGDSVPQSLTQHMSPSQLREQKMVELKRRYVDDEISVDQYEAELDKLMRETGQ